jgi:hypothetical protein
MLDIVPLVVFALMAVRIVVTVLRHSAIFAEFGQSKVLVFLAPLFPVGPLLLLFFRNQSLALALGAASACYLPALFVARRQIHAFDRAGTDRVKGALGATYQAFGTAIAGLVYIATVVVLGLLIGSRIAA